MEKEENNKITCSRCKGRGWEFIKIIKDITGRVPCTKCLGEGKLDWVENIVGKKRKKFLYVLR